jgi:3'-5' exonuclease
LKNFLNLSAIQFVSDKAGDYKIKNHNTMLEYLDITNVLFFDIETVPSSPNYSDLDETWQYLWTHKAKGILRKTDEEMSEDDAANVYDRAGIYAEFGQIVCISVGIFARDKATGELSVRLKSYASKDEAELLRGFSEMLNKHFPYPEKHYLCGHNIKEFDVPFICRRMVIHQMPFPALLNVTGKKPWETKHLLDTMELWKFGDNKAHTSLKLLAATLGFPSPKDDIDGSQVRGVFYDEGDVDRIARYCEKDVVAVMQLMLRYKRMPQRLTIDGQVIAE